MLAVIKSGFKKGMSSMALHGTIVTLTMPLHHARPNSRRPGARKVSESAGPESTRLGRLENKSHYHFGFQESRRCVACLAFHQPLNVTSCLVTCNRNVVPSFKSIMIRSSCNCKTLYLNGDQRQNDMS